MRKSYFFFCLYFLFSFTGYSQTINTFAGNGVAAYSGDGAAATSASMSRPIFCFKDSSGDLLISDFNNSCIRKVSPSGIITTIAGTGTAGYSGDGGLATAAEMNSPAKVAVDGAGNIYFCDFYNQCIRKINTAGIISTIAGTGTIGYTGDGGPATSATFWYPGDLALDNASNIYVSDEWNNRIRKIDAATGIITTIAGTGPLGFLLGGYSGDGAAASAAAINFPVGIVVMPTGDILFADNGNHRVRKISTSGIITTIVGDGTLGSSGDGGPATSAELHSPEGIALDPAGDLYICESDGNRVREVNTSGIINSIAGNGVAAYSGDGGPAISSQVSFPEGIFVDTTSSCIYICDADNNRVRVIGSCAAVVDTVCDTNYARIDTTTCSRPSGIILDAPAGFSSYAWNTGATTRTINIDTSGIYWVSAATGCSLSVDTFHMTTYNPVPVINLGPDTTVCTGTTIMLSSSAPSGSSYIWNTGATTNTIDIITAGIYWVSATVGCSLFVDTFHITYNPVPVINLGPDTTICAGTTIILSSAEPPGSVYLWSTGSTEATIEVANSGNYLLTVTDNGCTAFDSVEVTSLYPPTLYLGGDTILCQGQQLLLVADTNTSYTYAWSDVIHAAPPYTVTQAGTYWVAATNTCGTVSDTINVVYYFCDLWFPSAFTPNGDGHDDMARVRGLLSEFTDFSLSIYNRFGQRVFYTQDIYEGWDGIFNGIKQDLGTYYYFIYYTLGGKQSMMKGDLTLIR